MIIDERLQKEALQEICRKKFHGHDILISKYTPVFPAGIEREYARISRQYMRLLKETIEEEIPALKEQIMKERGTYRTGYRSDGINDVMMLLEKVLDKIQKRFTEKTHGYGLRRKLESLANMTRKLTIREWKKAVDKTLGINIMEDYYMGEFFQTALDRWVDENVSLIKAIPADTLGDMRAIVKDGFLGGKSATSIMKEIQQKYNDVGKTRAKLLARDQIGKLNAAVTKAQQQDAGIEEYIWDDCGDGRVRKCHKELNGQRFRWDDPPEMWYMTKSGKKMTGRHCHPGEDVGCRCRAKPVFKFGVFNAPAAKKE